MSKVLRQTMRADGLTVGQAIDQDASFLRDKGIPAKDGAAVLDERMEQFQDKVRDAVLNALDSVMVKHGKSQNGWVDADLPDLFKAVDRQAKILFERHRL